MKYTLIYGFLSGLLLLTACSGGGGSNGGPSGSGPVEPPNAEPEIIWDITSQDMHVSSHLGDALPLSVEGSWTGLRMDSDRVYVQLFDESNRFIMPVTQEVIEDTSFTLDTTLNSTVPVGEHTPTLSLVACKDIDCAEIYDDSEMTFVIKLSVAAVPEWQTHQANASHNGFVPIWINTTEFTKLWEWQRGPSSEPIGGINAPVAGHGEVYVSTDVYFGDASVIALDELTGEESWRVSFGTMPSLNPPAINSDTLFVATSGHEDTKLWGISRADQRLKFQSVFSSQWGNYLAPTAYGELVFQTGGYHGDYTYAFASDNGNPVWSKSPGASSGMDTAAVDEEHVYVHSGAALTVFEKNTGQLVTSIDDPFGNARGDYHGAPVKGSTDNVLAFSGGAFSGRASSNVEHYDARVISNFDVQNSEYLWSSEFTYRTFFAVSKGVVYAAKDNPVSLDAIDEVTGDILWSWVPPSTLDTDFHRNIVVTKNVLFVSTNSHLYAIDLESREAIWSYDEAGMIAISDNRILLLAPGYRESDGRLIAFDLRLQ